MDSLENLFNSLNKSKWGTDHSSFSSLCPFHNDSTPSFGVSFTKDAFNCFSCGEHGNLNKLCKHLGIPTINFNPYKKNKGIRNKQNINESFNKLRAKFYEEEETHFFYKRYKKYEDAILNPNYYPETYLYEHNYLDYRSVNEYCKDNFLVRYDIVHQALFAPIFDLNHQIIGNFRRYKKEGLDIKCSYSENFKSSQSIYGLQNFSNQACLILTEGIIDSNATLNNLQETKLDEYFYSSSIYSATNFNKEHVKLIESRAIQHILLLYDNDKAGLEGIEKVKNTVKNISRIKFYFIDYSQFPLAAHDPEELSPLELESLLQTMKEIKHFNIQDELKKNIIFLQKQRELLNPTIIYKTLC